MRIATLLARAGCGTDAKTGAISTPIYQSATFCHPGLGESTGFDYARTGNPTRAVLEKTLAELDGGARASAFSSGMAAIDAVFRLIPDGGRNRVVLTEDPYGGTVRLMDRFGCRAGLVPVYADTSDSGAVERELERGGVALVMVEIPSNPLLRVADIARLAEAARAAGALLAVDNTFLTPWLFRPFEHGADLVLYSVTKYLAGHNDVLAGAVVSRTREMGDRVAYVQNAAGAVPGPMDCWLTLRGVKTLGIRMDRQQANALRVAEFLSRHRRVTRTRYPGLPGDPGYERLRRQASGSGAIVSFEVERSEMVPDILANVRAFAFAESLGGVESLITYPLVQTHADLAPELRERLGLNDRLLRLSIGIEDAEDLVEDLDRTLRMAM
ncbi:MAG: PLP-dependent aspartate aminotransferase family protein [Planctomycetota bacterium]|jgi:cystathionine beta-lyase/cystathionine gamma-synthase|nr:PLP-dependent aspartate aminotransferase family protein [Planctomycetota bacterium]